MREIYEKYGSVSDPELRKSVRNLIQAGIGRLITKAPCVGASFSTSRSEPGIMVGGANFAWFLQLPCTVGRFFG